MCGLPLLMTAGNCWQSVWIWKTSGKLAQIIIQMVLLEECFSESGTRYGQYELLLGAANGSETRHLLYLMQTTG